MYVPVLGMSPDELPGPVSVGHDLARRPVGEELPVVAGEHAHHPRALYRRAAKPTQIVK